MPYGLTPLHSHLILPQRQVLKLRAVVRYKSQKSAKEHLQMIR